MDLAFAILLGLNTYVVAGFICIRRFDPYQRLDGALVVFVALFPLVMIGATAAWLGRRYQSHATGD
jgi:hypothetical protein